MAPRNSYRADIVSCGSTLLVAVPLFFVQFFNTLLPVNNTVCRPGTRRVCSPIREVFVYRVSGTYMCFIYWLFFSVFTPAPRVLGEVS